MWLLDTLLQIDSVRTQRTVNFGVDSAARFGLKCNPFRVNASFRARALRLTHFVKRSKAGNWLLSSASALALAATISPTVGVAQTQVGSWCPNPTAEGLAWAERAQEPKYRFIYIDDAEIDGVSVPKHAPVGENPQAYYRDHARIHHPEPGQYFWGLHQGRLA